ncbi:MAG: hypothetical protein IAG13_09475 [Deltaproteobacteria bacterium]|nr:hypothetical protein [Nannocystaceae bacterium]
MSRALPKIHAAVAALALTLTAGSAVAGTPAATQPGVVDLPPAPTPLPPSRGERAGAALLMMGGMGSVVGFTLLIVGVRYEPDEPGFRARKDFRPAAGGVLAISFATVIAGAIAFGVHRKSRRGEAKVSLAPALSARQAGLSLVGRF